MQSTLCDLTRNLFGSSKLEIEISVEKCIPEIAAVAKQRAVYRLVISIQIPLFVWRRQKMSTYMRTFKSNLYSRDTRPVHLNVGSNFTLSILRYFT